MMTSDQLQLLESFTQHLSKGARILYAAQDERDIPPWLRSQGFEVEEVDPAKDLRFLALKRESYRAIWSGKAVAAFNIEEAQRIIAIFFQALEPRTGILATLHRFPEEAFASMIRQNGFNPLLQGVREDWWAIIARRI
jgi:hypothetical protein